MGYRANWQAQALSHGRSFAIGLLYQGALPLLNSVYNELVERFVQALRDRGYHMQLVPIENSASWKEALLGRRVAGCATLHRVPDAILEIVAEFGIPTVLLDMNQGHGLATICPDDER